MCLFTSPPALPLPARPLSHVSSLPVLLCHGARAREWGIIIRYSAEHSVDFPPPSLSFISHQEKCQPQPQLAQDLNGGGGGGVRLEEIRRTDLFAAKCILRGAGVRQRTSTGCLQLPCKCVNVSGRKMAIFVFVCFVYFVSLPSFFFNMYIYLYIYDVWGICNWTATEQHNSSWAQHWHCKPTISAHWGRASSFDWNRDQHSESPGIVTIFTSGFLISTPSLPSLLMFLLLIWTGLSSVCLFYIRQQVSPGMDKLRPGGQMRHSNLFIPARRMWRNYINSKS